MVGSEGLVGVEWQAGDEPLVGRNAWVRVLLDGREAVGLPSPLSEALLEWTDVDVAMQAVSLRLGVTAAVLPPRGEKGYWVSDDLNRNFSSYSVNGNVCDLLYAFLMLLVEVGFLETGGEDGQDELSFRWTRSRAEGDAGLVAVRNILRTFPIGCVDPLVGEDLGEGSGVWYHYERPIEVPDGDGCEVGHEVGHEVGGVSGVCEGMGGDWCVGLHAPSGLRGMYPLLRRLG